MMQEDQIKIIKGKKKGLPRDNEYKKIITLTKPPNHFKIKKKNFNANQANNL